LHVQFIESINVNKKLTMYTCIQRPTFVTVNVLYCVAIKIGNVQYVCFVTKVVKFDTMTNYSVESINLVSHPIVWMYW